MLSYRHGFHAGNWADVHKHAALTLLLAHLRGKAKPFTVVDAFAGDAVYDLTAPEALKTAEFESGIARVWTRKDAPPGVAEYLDVVRAFNAGGRLARYPGSPAIARASLREADRMILSELHPTAYAQLKRWAAADKRIAVHKRDGLELLGAVLPPAIRRGVVLIDPAYEVKSDYDAVPAALARALRRWPEGIYAVWYPILPEGRHRALCGAIAPWKPVLSEIGPDRRPERGLQRAGVAVINAPFGVAAALETAREFLARALFAL
jgi:23S rRNA (adenine2030-N6)-methyltransferase